MSDVKLSMDFDCCGCEESVGITVICQSKNGYAIGMRAVAAAEIRCPHCAQANQVCFHPTGEVVAVMPLSRICRIPQPSLN